MLMELLNKVTSVALLTFLISSMLAMGTGLTAGQIVAPLRNVRLVAVALLANFVLMPLVALALAKVLWLDEPLATGLILIGCAAGAPVLPKLAEIAKSNLPFAVGVMVLLTVFTVGCLPLSVPLLLPGVAVNPAKMALSLVLQLLLPLGIGLVVKAYYDAVAVRVKPTLDWLSYISLILLTVLIVVANLDKIVLIGTRAILAALLFSAVGFGVGWLLGGPGRDVRPVLALGTGIRNIAASLVVGSQSFDDPLVIVMVVAAGAIQMGAFMPVARVLGNRQGM
jgi:bile acid:Na+ symporter, BASS family